MASLTLITIPILVNVLTIFTQTCNCEIYGPPSSSYTEAKFPGHQQVVYVPVCTPDCFKSSNILSNCQQKSLASLPLQNHEQTYHSQLDLGGHQQQYQRYSQLDYSKSQNSNSQSYHLASDVSKKEYHSGSATVYQQNNHHSSEQKHSINHHGSGVSQQSFSQQHQQSQDLSSQVQDIDYDKSDELHHKKDQNIHYVFEYSVNDQKTGDIKRQREERKGDVVNGEYSLLEEDGNVRTVKYQADWKSGFHAQVYNSKRKSVG